MERIYVKHIREIFGSREEVPIINVLPQKEFEKERIIGSINIPFEEPGQFLQAVEAIVPSKRQKIVVHSCHEGSDLSERAAKTLEEAGFDEVMDFAGGLKEWKEAGEEVISENP